MCILFVPEGERRASYLYQKERDVRPICTGRAGGGIVWLRVLCIDDTSVIPRSGDSLNNHRHQIDDNRRDMRAAGPGAGRDLLSARYSVTSRSAE
jgi:hypothetical protein